MSNTLKISTALLLVVLSLANAHHNMCTADMDEETCKMDFMKNMDKEMMEKHIGLMKMTMSKMMKTFTDDMMDMPADNPHMKMMRTTMDNMKADMEMMDTMMNMNDRMKLQEMIEKMYHDMQPDLSMADKEDSTNADRFKQMMMKYKEMITEARMSMMMEFEKLWDHMYAYLREKDMKKYPMYMEMNDMMTKMKSMTEMKDKSEMMMMMMTKMMKFQETPYMKAMLMAMCDNCDN